MSCQCRSLQYSRHSLLHENTTEKCTDTLDPSCTFLWQYPQAEKVQQQVCRRAVLSKVFSSQIEWYIKAPKDIHSRTFSSNAQGESEDAFTPKHGDAIWDWNWHYRHIEMSSTPSPWLTWTPSSHKWRTEGGFELRYPPNRSSSPLLILLRNSYSQNNLYSPLNIYLYCLLQFVNILLGRQMNSSPFTEEEQAYTFIAIEREIIYRR